ncbi:MAG: sulfur carrier protein ThiS [Gammaproteobacteria bacterium]|nr:sulfur carrier protein ThiS [Gammaproteobacteria bacterium]
MNIRFNGDAIFLAEPQTLLQVMQSQLNDSEMVLKRSVVAVNQSLIPKNEWQDYTLQENDEIEVLTAVVGG